MKKYITALLLMGTLLAQAQQRDTAGQANLARRSEIFQAKQAEKQSRLQRRATELGIPMQISTGKSTATLRSITPNGEPIYDQPDNIISVESIGADSVKAGGGLGLALTGAGQTLGIWEAFETAGNAAVRTTHQEFGGRATLVDAGGFSDHATHVAGTMIAAGIQANAEGFSTGADLLCYDLSNDVAEMDAAAQAMPPVRISNHSYGTRTGWRWNNTTMQWDWSGGAANEDWKFGAYTDDTQAWDEVAFNNPFLAVFKSAGNDRGDGPGTMPVGPEMDGGADGFDCIPTYGTAKNIITVGAVRDVVGGYSGPGAVLMSTFSSWGPTDDGRIKPDIVANGVGLTSTYSGSDMAYGDFDGTSMSTPSAAGGAGLLLEHWANTLGGAPRSATLKGLMIHAADECGTSVGPDYSFGWGLANIGDAAQLISLEQTDGCRQLVEGSVADNEVFTFDIYSDGQVPLKVTLTWTDVPSTITNNATLNPAGADYLENDLDLRLVHNGTTTFFPWVLDPNNPGNPATTGDNNRDNVEQVLLLNPAAGLYTIQVEAPVTVLSGPQRFALWLSGNGAETANVNVSGVVINDRRLYAARENIVFGPLPVTLVAPADVRAYAGQSVVLQPGFHATAGSRFQAKVVSMGGCGAISANLKADNYPGLRPELVAGDNKALDWTTLEPESELSLELSPNPTVDYLNVGWSNGTMASDAQIRVFDQYGVLVQNYTVTPQTQTQRLDVSRLPAGVYTCVLAQRSGVLAKSFVVAE